MGKIFPPRMVLSLPFWFAWAFLFACSGDLSHSANAKLEFDAGFHVGGDVNPPGDGDKSPGVGPGPGPSGDGDNGPGPGPNGDGDMGPGPKPSGDGDMNVGDGDTSIRGDGDMSTGDGDMSTGDGDLGTGDGDTSTGDGDGTGTPTLVAATYIGDPGSTNPMQNQSPRNAIWSRTGDLIVSGLGGQGAPVTQGAFQTTYGGESASTGNPGSTLGGDCWIGRFTDDLSSLTAATYYGGAGAERPCYGLDEFPDGRIVVAGSTMSPTGMATAGAYVTSRPSTNLSTGFAAVFSADLTSRPAATYIGGNGDATIRGGCRVMSNGDVVTFGQIDTPGMATAGAIQGSPAGGGNDAWIGAMSPDMKTLRWGTYLGSNSAMKTEVVMGVKEVGGDIVLYSMSPSTAWLSSVRTGGAMPTGGDGTRPYVARMAPNGTSFRWVTTLGSGEGNAISGIAWAEAGMAVDANNNIYVTGETETSMGTPGTVRANLQGPTDCFVCKVAGNGALQWCTHLGGTGDDYCLAPSVGSNGNVMVVGTTNASNFCDGATTVLNGRHSGGTDAFVAVLSPDGARVEFCTLIGGSGNEVGRMTAVRPSDGRVAITGMTQSNNFPATSGAFDTTYNGNDDMFVVVLDGLPL